VQYLDSNWTQPAVAKPPVKSFDQLIPDSVKSMVAQRASSRASSFYTSNEGLLWEYQQEKKLLRRHQIEWHRKISLSLACLVLFLIGAPLGSIIRKGGLGNSMISSIVFFMLFYFISNTGEKFAKEGAWPVYSGMWLSTVVLVPVGLFLTYKALHDSQLFNKEYYFRMSGKLRTLLKRNKA
jgi:lipopolysaccharide export system permease protein